MYSCFASNMPNVFFMLTSMKYANRFSSLEMFCLYKRLVQEFLNFWLSGWIEGQAYRPKFPCLGSPRLSSLKQPCTDDSAADCNKPLSNSSPSRNLRPQMQSYFEFILDYQKCSPNCSLKYQLVHILGKEPCIFLPCLCYNHKPFAAEFISTGLFKWPHKCVWIVILWREPFFSFVGTEATKSVLESS